MIEIITALIEPIVQSFKSANFADLKKRHDSLVLGTELLLLYNSLNEILNVHRTIHENLNRSLSWLREKLEMGESDRMLSTSLVFLLQQQLINFQKVRASIKRLGENMRIIDPEIFIRVAPIIYGNSCPLDILLELISGDRPLLVSIDEKRFHTLLADIPANLEIRGGEPTFERRVTSVIRAMSGKKPAVDGLFTFMRVNDLDFIEASEYATVRGYLNQQNSLSSDRLVAVLETLREIIKANFAASELLLNVGDERSIVASRY